MKTKRFFSVLCTLALLMSPLIGTFAGVTMKDVYAEDVAVNGTDEKLAVPENLRYEDGFIVWDEVENAYGYTLLIQGEDNENDCNYYVNRVELDRLCYDYNKPFGEYTFKVCAFNESGARSEWSSSVTASYEPSFTMPENVRPNENTEDAIVWDEVEGAARYNIRIFNDDENRTLNSQTWQKSADFSYKYYLYESGNYWISIQAMDRDYNVSEWTEPIQISFTYTVEESLEFPKNLRFDESGENVLWDAVEGADYYYIQITSYIDNKRQDLLHTSYYAEQTEYKNWKADLWPFSCGTYEISVYAYNNQGMSSNYSECIKGSFYPDRDETIGLPESIQVESGYLKWDNIKNAKKYWLCISVNNELIQYEWNSAEAGSDCSIQVGNRLPEGTYEAELFVVDENNHYNNKTYTVTLDTVHDNTVWVPEMFYKFDTILWDYDRLRHENTDFFWIRIKKDDKVIQLVKYWDGVFEGLPNLTDGSYTVETCVYENYDKLGEWSKPLKILKHEGGFFDKENESTSEVITPPEAEGIPEDDRITSITINPAFNMKDKEDNNVELDLSKIKIKANEIYDEEGLKRAEEALGEALKGNTHYNLLDLTLLYDGEDFSNGYEGLVQVIIPIPKGHRDKTFTCYRLTEVDGKMIKEIIPGTQTEDSYIIYLEHFSEYALVGEGEHVHDYGESWKTDETNHWKECECKEKSEEAEHVYGDWVVTKKATEAEEGIRERSCKVCIYKQTETLPKLLPPVPPVEEKEFIEFLNKDTKIEVIAPIAAFDNVEDVIFNVSPAAEQTNAKQSAFNLGFTDKKGNKIQPKTAVTIKIPLLESLKDKNIYVYHVGDNGAYTEISCTIENGMAVFSVFQLDTFIIAGEKLGVNRIPSETTSAATTAGIPETTAKDAPDKTTASVSRTVMKNPDTSDPLTTGVIALPFISAMLAGVTTIVYKKKK